MAICILTLKALATDSKLFAGEPLVLAEPRGLSQQHQVTSNTIIVGVAGSNEEQPKPPKSGAGQRPHDEIGTKTPGASEPCDQVQALKQQIIEVQNKGKLGFTKIVPYSAVEGFGMYSPRAPGQFAPRIAFYCEPSNVSTLVSDGRYVTDCTVDVVLLDLTGKPLLGRENVVKINRVSRSPVMDLYFKIEVNVQKLGAWKLNMKIVLHDKIENQSVTATQRINVEGGLKKGLGDI